MSLKSIFATNLKQARRMRGLTHEKLSELVGLSIETVGRVERGQTAPSFETAELLAKALDLPAQRLFGLEGCVDPSSRRGAALLELQACLADATDGQIELLVGIAAVIRKKA